MMLIADVEESKRLEQKLRPNGGFLTYDIVLDEGTWLPNTVVIDDKAFGLLIGGHTGFQFFRDIPQLAGRTVFHWLKLRRRHGLLLIGWWFRKRWARAVGARLEYPTWRVRI
ncbi:MAG TPA: hypothetical protein VGR14_20035 [Verrucomicrobiae bacterium]|nr:hypothetical protein [Verrucomicrobiae bacterium]